MGGRGRMDELTLKLHRNAVMEMDRLKTAAMKIVCSLENRSCTLGKALTYDATAVESGGAPCNKFLSNPCQPLGYALFDVQPSAGVKVKGAMDAIASKFCYLHTLGLRRLPGCTLFFWIMTAALLFTLARPSRVILSNR